MFFKYFINFVGLPLCMFLQGYGLLVQSGLRPLSRNPYMLFPWFFIEGDHFYWIRVSWCKAMAFSRWTLLWAVKLIRKLVNWESFHQWTKKSCHFGMTPMQNKTSKVPGKDIGDCVSALGNDAIPSNHHEELYQLLEVLSTTPQHFAMIIRLTPEVIEEI